MGADAGRRLHRRFAIDVAQDNGAAFARCAGGAGEPHAPRRTGDQDHLSAEPAGYDGVGRGGRNGDAHVPILSDAGPCPPCDSVAVTVSLIADAMSSRP